jgi:hypothetical protein
MDACSLGGNLRRNAMQSFALPREPAVLFRQIVADGRQLPLLA